MKKVSNLQQNKKTFKSIMDSLEIDESATKINQSQKKFNKFANSVVPEPDFNYMVDLLALPETSKGKYKYLFVIMDLATNKFDIEPMKNTQSESSVIAMKAIIKRGILEMPEISIKTDGGPEFKKQFDTYLTKHGVYHGTAMAHRKSQMAPVERLNRSLSRILMNYLNKKTLEHDDTYSNWTDILPVIRNELNDFRERDVDKLKEFQSESFFDAKKKPQFEIGNVVHYRLMKPTDIRGNKINSNKFREGDRVYSIDRKKIINILYYPDEPYYRYKLSGMPHISFSSQELKLASDQQDTMIVKDIIGKKQMNKVKYYLVWYKGELRKDASYQKASDLVEDGLQDYIDAYEKSNRKKSKKR